MRQHGHDGLGGGVVPDAERLDGIGPHPLDPARHQRVGVRFAYREGLPRQLRQQRFARTQDIAQHGVDEARLAGGILLGGLDGGVDSGVIRDVRHEENLLDAQQQGRPRQRRRAALDELRQHPLQPPPAPHGAEDQIHYKTPVLRCVGQQAVGEVAQLDPADEDADGGLP